MIERSLKKTTMKGLLWSFIDSFGTTGLRFIISILLARILMPEMFGLLAMLTIFITLGDIFVDSGFGTALIQKKTITETDICSVFYFNIFIGFLSALLMFIGAPIIAEFYGQPTLTAMARVLSIIYVANSFGMVQANLLIKNLDFKSFTKLNVIANLASGFIGITMAIMGFGVWSLVVQQISASLLRNYLYWFFSNWRPYFLFRFDSLRVMFRYSVSIMATSFLNRTTDSIYYMVIGRVFSAASLGFFSRAQQLVTFPSSTLATVIGRVTFPVYSKLQGDPATLKNGLRKTLIIVSFLICPIMVGIASAADHLVEVLLTNKWSPSVSYMQWLCLVGLLFPMEWIRQQTIQAVGRPDMALRVEIIKKVVLFSSITTTWRWGMRGIIAGMIVASLISITMNVHYIAKLTEYSIKEQVNDLLPYVALSIVTGGVILGISELLHNEPVYCQLAAQIILGAAFYLGTAWIFKTAAIELVQRELTQNKSDKRSSLRTIN